MPVRRTLAVAPSQRTSTPAAAADVVPSGAPTASRLTSDFTPTHATPVQARLTELRALMSGHADRREERRMLTVLREAPAGEVNQLLQGLSVKELHELKEAMDDRLVGLDARTEYLALLTQERAPELTVESKLKLIQSMQVGATDGQEEQAIAALLLSTKGEALTALKNGLDQGGDYRDLQQLVFRDLDSKPLRAKVLAHFAAEAPPKSHRVKVLSDIDDTFYANLKDTRYPKKTVYPGVRALYAELDKGAAAQADRPGDLMFLSARPYDAAGLVETQTRSMLADHEVTKATVLSGDFLHLVGNQAIADKKYENWQQVQQLYPEYGSVFLGDSGQGDALFGARAHGANADLRAAFIHDVTGLDGAARAEWARQGVFVFDTYVGAATEAFRRGLISAEGLDRVVTEAGRELRRVPFESDAQRQAREAELARDVAAARAALGTR